MRALISMLLVGAMFVPVMHHWSETISHDLKEHSHLDQSEYACNELLDQDPCHRKLVHHDESAGCDHEAHLTAQLSQCPFCSMALLRFDAWVRFPLEFTLFKSKAAVPFFDDQETFISALLKLNESRGPPAILVL